ncbi:MULTISPECIES: hypothetical protein [unclassified Pseudomonas]|uniref:hypothetical protein n=1 Tax=unclassified Pseudomonas TaxID=196821 RepID=UPI000CD20072|nr:MULTISPECIES: hypothetical protein [unclassified Pseudomonas]POA53527.1 hypothetical protein C1889_18495 [Pseudomonas sp. FW507-12TSA]
MKKWKLAVFGVVSLALAGCEKGPSYEFEGQYFAAEGENCTTPASTKDLEHYFLKITKQVGWGRVLYSATLPSAVKAGLPAVSAQGVSPNDDNELTFHFSKARVTGVPPENPDFNIVVTVIPNKNREGHLWLIKETMIINKDGEVKEFDILERLRDLIEVGQTGACLRKATATG